MEIKAGLGGQRQTEGRGAGVLWGGGQQCHLLISQSSPGKETQRVVFGRWCSWAGTPREGQREPLVFLKFLPVSVTMVPSSSREAGALNSPVAHVLARCPPVALAPVVSAHGVPGLPLGRVHLQDEVGSVETHCRGERPVSLRPSSQLHMGPTLPRTRRLGPAPPGADHTRGIRRLLSLLRSALYPTELRTGTQTKPCAQMFPGGTVPNSRGGTTQVSVSRWRHHRGSSATKGRTHGHTDSVSPVTTD